MSRDKIVTLQDLIRIVRKTQKAGKKVVWTNGCFDLLHVGHVRYLEKARALGDILIVGLNSNSSTRKLKGPNRPIVRQAHRAEVLAALETVDYITTIENYRATADVRREFFRDEFPAATGVIVAGLLRPDALIEIDAVAIIS